MCIRDRDFAYAVHTEVGNHCVGAKVNGRIVPLSYELQMGDRVEILTQKSATPSRGWLSIVKTPSARSKIRGYFSKVTRGDDMQLGHEKLAREMRKHGIGISNAQSTRAIKSVAESLGYKDGEDMIVAIGAGKVAARNIDDFLGFNLGPVYSPTGIVLAVLLIFLSVEKVIDREQAEIKSRREEQA